MTPPNPADADTMPPTVAGSVPTSSAHASKRRIGTA